MTCLLSLGDGSRLSVDVWHQVCIKPVNRIRKPLNEKIVFWLHTDRGPNIAYDLVADKRCRTVLLLCHSYIVIAGSKSFVSIRCDERLLCVCVCVKHASTRDPHLCFLRPRISRGWRGLPLTINWDRMEVDRRQEALFWSTQTEWMNYGW